MMRALKCKQAQMVATGVTEDVFSLCLGSIEGDGALLLGDVQLAPWTDQLAYTPMVQARPGPVRCSRGNAWRMSGTCFV